MTDVIDFSTYRSDRRIAAFAIPAPRYRVGDRVRSDREGDALDRAGTVTRHLGYDQFRQSHCYTVQTPRLIFVADETRLARVEEIG